MRLEIRNRKSEIRNLCRHHTRRGSVYVIALLTLSVLAMFAAVLGWGAIVRAQQAQKRESSRYLESLIQSGVAYASWQRRYQNRDLPFSFNLSFGSGRITGYADKAPAYGSDAMKITVNATYKDNQMTKQRIISGAERSRQTTEFALFVDSSLYVVNGTIKIEGDLHVNGRLVTRNGWIAYATGSITSSGNQIGNVVADTYSEKFTPTLQENLPTMTELRMQATQLLMGPLTMPFGMNLNSGDIQYVQGDLQLQGRLIGSGIVVVEGNLTFTGKTWYDNKHSLYVFVVQGDIVIPDRTEISGYLISKNGNVHIGKDSQVDPGGIMVADGTLNADGDLAIAHDPRVNTDFFRQLSRVVEIDDDTAVPFP